jgi:hypothetical protein
MGIGLILANQSMEDLRKANMLNTVETNCRLRQYFAVSSLEDKERVSKLSGQTVDTTLSKTTSDKGESTTVSQILLPRLSIDDLTLITNDDFESVFWLKRAGRDGYAQYGGFMFPAESDYHISQDTYETRKNADLEQGMGTLLEPPPRPNAPRDPAPLPPRPAPVSPTITSETIDSGHSLSGAPDPFESFERAKRERRRRKQS